MASSGGACHPGSSLTLSVRRTYLDLSSANRNFPVLLLLLLLTKGDFDLWALGPVGDSLFCRGSLRPLLLRLPAPAPSGSGRLFRICHLSCIRTHSCRLHLAHIISAYILLTSENSCLVFVNFLPFSNRRFPYLGFSGNFRSSNYTFRFLVSICPTGDIARDPIHTPSQGFPAAGRAPFPCVMTSLQHSNFFAHILPHRVSR
jgi:hypothetical protein